MDMEPDMSISNVISLLSGIALFLFGMALMGDGLKKVAGNKLEVILYQLTGKPLKGFLLGTAVTAVIQSSSATSVMVARGTAAKRSATYRSDIVPAGWTRFFAPCPCRAGRRPSVPYSRF